MLAAGVPVVPSSDAVPGSTRGSGLTTRKRSGWPYDIASRCCEGGGRRRWQRDGTVFEPAELPRALAAARREAKSAFGDDTSTWRS